MNSVHEQCPQTVTHNSALSQNWVGCTRCTPWPSLRALSPGRPCLAVSWLALVQCRRPSTGYVAGPLGRIVAVSMCARASWADRIVAHQAPCRGLSRDTPSSQASAPCHDTLVCIVTRLANQTVRLSRYKDCIVTQPPAVSPSLMSRDKTLYRDTLHQPGCARACCRMPLRAAGPVVASFGRVVGVAQSPAPRTAVSRYNSLYCDSNG